MGGGGGGAVDADAVVAEIVARAPPNGSVVESRRPALNFTRFGDGPPLGVVFVVVIVVVFMAAALEPSSSLRRRSSTWRARSSWRWLASATSRALKANWVSK